MKLFLITLTLVLACSFSRATELLIPMDETQKNHLKAYGIAYWCLHKKGVEVEWLLNYRGGSFMIPHNQSIEKECIIRGVSYEVVANLQAQRIHDEIADPKVNMEIVKLEKAPKIAVYTPDKNAKGEKVQPWDDAVTLVLTYAEIPYETIYDSSVVMGELPKYDWLHLHHEDFTGQYGKFYRNYRNHAWYRKQVADSEATAKQLGFNKVSELKLGVASKIRDYTAGGGFLFTMCSGTDSYDIALAAAGTDICDHMYDGDPADANAQSKLDYDNTLAFKNFTLHMNPLEYEFSSIDGTMAHTKPEKNDVFTLFDFSAKWDIVPTMLTQNHTKVVKGFMGQTTDFYKKYLKKDVRVMGEDKSIGTVKYMHGTFGKGTWTFYGGHDPEDYRHYVGDPATDLNLFPNSAGYRLILNNVLFPAAKKKHKQT
jgi:hypothetical protein